MSAPSASGTVQNGPRDHAADWRQRPARLTFPYPVPRTPVTLDAYRDLFQTPPDLVYLDHAATGVLGTHVTDAVGDYLAGRAGRVPGRSPNNYPADLERVDRARARAAALVGARAEAVCVVPHTSAGLGLVAGGLDWRPGDRVAAPACEFPANVLPWRALAARGVELDLVPHHEGTVSVDDVADALTPQTRVVAVSAVQFLSGFRADLAGLADLCRQRGAYLVVDAIQAVGAVRVDIDGVDLLATGGHKWLGAMQGAGVAVVSDRLLDRLEPARGWLNGPVDWDDFEATTDALHPDATRFHTGTYPTAAVYALDAAVGAMLAVGPDAIEAAVLANAAALADGLERLGYTRYGEPGPPRSGIVTVRADRPEALHAHLAERGVTASVRSRLVRFAPHAHTRPHDIDRTLAAVAEFAPVAA